MTKSAWSETNIIFCLIKFVNDLNYDTSFDPIPSEIPNAIFLFIIKRSLHSFNENEKDFFLQKSWYISTKNHQFPHFFFLNTIMELCHLKVLFWFRDDFTMPQNLTVKWCMEKIQNLAKMKSIVKSVVKSTKIVQFFSF